MTQTERDLVAQALEHLLKSRDLHDFGDMEAYKEARYAREILQNLLKGEPQPAEAKT